jgi:hypothetical protein
LSGEPQSPGIDDIIKRANEVAGEVEHESALDADTSSRRAEGTMGIASYRIVALQCSLKRNQWADARAVNSEQIPFSGIARILGVDFLWSGS